MEPLSTTMYLLEISCFKNDWSKGIKTVTVSGSSSTSNFTLNFQPIYFALNYDSKINDASSHEVRIIKNIGSINSTLGKLIVDVKDQGQDSSLLRIVHHYVKPDPFKNNSDGHTLSNQRYWHIEGILSQGFYASAKFNYNGNKTIGGTYSYLDTLLTQTNGDSISLFYRKDAHADWALVKNVSKVMQGSKHGYIELDTLRLGEYCFGNSSDLTYLGNLEISKENSNVSIYPNPASGTCKVEIEGLALNTFTLKIYSLDGKLIKKAKLNSGVNIIEMEELPKDSLIFSVWDGQKKEYSTTVVNQN